MMVFMMVVVVVIMMVMIIVMVMVIMVVMMMVIFAMLDRNLNAQKELMSRTHIVPEVRSLAKT